MSAIGLPPHILTLFQSRPPLEFMKPPCTRRRESIAYRGISDIVSNFENGPPPPVVPFETPREARLRLAREKRNNHEEAQKKLIEQFRPHENENATSDPFRTLFIARANYETTEKKLKREFEQYGPVKRVRLITDLNGKPWGYGFIEFESDRDMKEAYKLADGKKVDGRRLLVDVERARTVPGWLPRKLGGGRGPPRGSNTKPKNATVVTSSTTRGGVSGGTVGGDENAYGRGAAARDSRSGAGGGSSQRGDYRAEWGGANSYPVGSSRHRDRDRDRDRERGRDRDRDRDRSDRDKYSSYNRGSDRDRYRERSDRYSRERSRSRDRERRRSRSHDRDRERRRDRERSGRSDRRREKEEETDNMRIKTEEKYDNDVLRVKTEAS